MRYTFPFLGAVALGAAVAVSAVSAQPATPQGPRAAASAASGPGYGPGYGPGRGMMGGRWGSRYTPGWSMMTPQERDEHHRIMSQVRTQDDCRKAIDEHRALMEKRAGERGFTMRGPRADACRGLKP